MLDWDDLRYVLAVRRAGSLNAAARALKVDKATVSRRIGAVEHALGVRLFDRKPEGYSVTPHGDRVLAAVGQIDDTVAALVAELSDARGDANGVVYLSVPQFFASQVLLPALPRFRASHPGIDLVVNASSSVLNVARREAEVGLRNVKPDQLSVTVKRVGRLAMALYASRSYLARRGTPRAPQDLVGHDLVGWENAFTYAEAFRWINDCGARVPVRLNDAAVLCDAVAASLGIGALPCILGDERSGLVRLEGFGMGRDDIYAVAPGELRRSGRVRAVIELLVGAWRTNAARLSGER
jgi:DNA-binding transcriptional LysR family regulator